MSKTPQAAQSAHIHRTAALDASAHLAGALPERCRRAAAHPVQGSPERSRTLSKVRAGGRPAVEKMPHPRRRAIPCACNGRRALEPSACAAPPLRGK
eukprot:3130380-Prymnesium_polylepis.1